MLRFALCADDYGLTPGVSRGILELLAVGRLTAASAMVTQPGWPQDAAALRPFADAVDIGLHLNLTLGLPSDPMPALAPAGKFPALAALIRGALMGRLTLMAISTSMRCPGSGIRYCRPSSIEALPGASGSETRAIGCTRSSRGR